MGLNAPSGFRPGRAPNALRGLEISAPDHSTKDKEQEKGGKMENELCAPLDFRPTRESSAHKDFGDRVPDHPVIPHKPEKWKDSGMGLNPTTSHRLIRETRASQGGRCSGPGSSAKCPKLKWDQAASMGLLPEYVQRRSDSYIQCTYGVYAKTAPVADSANTTQNASEGEYLVIFPYSRLTMEKA